MSLSRTLFVLAVGLLTAVAAPRLALGENKVGVLILEHFPPQGKNYLSGPLYVMTKRKPGTEDEATVERQIFRRQGGEWTWFNSEHYFMTSPGQTSLEDIWNIVSSPGTYAVRAHSYKTGWTAWTPMRVFTVGPVIGPAGKEQPGIKPKPNPKLFYRPPKKLYPKPKPPGPPPVLVPGKGLQPRAQ